MRATRRLEPWRRSLRLLALLKFFLKEKDLRGTGKETFVCFKEAKRFWSIDINCYCI